MPPQIGDFISRQVYNGRLQSYSRHPISSGTTVCRFVDIRGSDQQHGGTSRIVSVATVASKAEGANRIIRIAKRSRPSRSLRNTSKRKNAPLTRSLHRTTRSGTRLNGHSKKKDSTGTTSALMLMRSRVRSFNVLTIRDCSHFQHA